MRRQKTDSKRRVRLRSKADPRSTSLVADVEAASAALKNQKEIWDTQRHAVKEMRSCLANTDETLHSAVRAAHLVILEDGHNHRRAPKFLTYFPRGLVGIFTAPYTDELQVVRCLAERCAQDPSPKIQEQAGPLGAAADQMSTALKRRTATMLAESVAYGQLQVEKIGAIETCRRTGHRLTELYPAQQERVRSYFRPIKRRARSTTLATGAPVSATEAAMASSPVMPPASMPGDLTKSLQVMPHGLRPAGVGRGCPTAPHSLCTSEVQTKLVAFCWHNR